MADIDSHPDNRSVNTDVFVVVENEKDDYDFVTIDEDLPSASIIINMSDDEFVEAVTVDFEENIGSDNFVAIDEDPIFISGFMENDDL